MSNRESSARRWQIIAALSGATAVIFGAFGGHGLKHLVGPDLQHTWHTAVEYQFLHTLALLAVALHANAAVYRWVLRLWLVGILLFSGSLYALVLTGQYMAAFVTPFGGLSLIAGWSVLAWGAWLRRSTDTAT
jgi:uncharacterized membrane protein YgdD (TMEM256/DUF423 family)